MENIKSIRSAFSLKRYPNEKQEKSIKFHLTLFLDYSIGLVVIIGPKEYQMIFFENLEDLKLRGGDFGLTSEDIAFTSRIFG